MSIMLITHNIGVVAAISHRIAVMYFGQGDRRGKRGRRSVKAEAPLYSRFAEINAQTRPQAEGEAVEYQGNPARSLHKGCGVCISSALFLIYAWRMR